MFLFIQNCKQRHKSVFEIEFSEWESDEKGLSSTMSLDVHLVYQTKPPFTWSAVCALPWFLCVLYTVLLTQVFRAWAQTCLTIMPSSNPSWQYGCYYDELISVLQGFTKTSPWETCREAEFPTVTPPTGVNIPSACMLHIQHEHTFYTWIHAGTQVFIPFSLFLSFSLPCVCLWTVCRWQNWSVKKQRTSWCVHNSVILVTPFQNIYQLDTDRGVKILFGSSFLQII